VFERGTTIAIVVKSRKETDMLPPFIIDQIRKREEDERHPGKEQVLELPLPIPKRPHEPRPPEDDADRGVVIIDLI
jgi:hypothetical protein